jgi:hypothetical protein
MESPQPFSMGFARKEYTVIRVRNDHQTRLRNLAALFEFIGNDVSYAFLRTQSSVGCFPHHQDGFLNRQRCEKKYRIAIALIQPTAVFQ